jgi:hypothetical protein
MDTRTPETNNGIGLVQMDEASLASARAESREPDITPKVDRNERDGDNEAKDEKASRRENGSAGLVADAKPSSLLGFNPLDILCRMFVIRGICHSAVEWNSVVEFSELPFQAERNC